MADTPSPVYSFFNFGPDLRPLIEHLEVISSIQTEILATQVNIIAGLGRIIDLLKDSDSGSSSQELMAALEKINARFDETEQSLGSMARRQKRHLKEDREMKVDLTDLKAQVTQTTRAVDSAEVLIRGLANKVQELGSSAKDFEELQAGINQLAKELNKETEELKEAVIINTEHEK